MKSKVIQILSITGSPIATFEVDSIQSLENLYKNGIFRITQTGLKSFDQRLDSKNQSFQENRFVVAKNQEQKAILQKVEPIRCFLRFSDTYTKIMKINPYHSVGWLKNIIYQQLKTPVKLTVNNVDLSQDRDSLFKYIFENAIIHANQINKTQHTLCSLKIKQPGSQSKAYTLQNIKTSLTIDQLIKNISYIFNIPYQQINIVYAGKILAKDKLISDYNIKKNGQVIVVDSRKYMKKISLKQYQQRQQQVKQMKQNNKEIIKKLKQQIQSEKKEKNKSGQKVVQSPEKKKLQYIMQKSGDKNLRFQQLQQGTGYLKEPKMSIQSQQYQQFQRLPQKLQSSQKSGANNPQLNRLNSLLKQGRIVTNQSEVYQDQQGYIHEHKKQKSIYRNGQKIVHTNITQDEHGNIIQVAKDIVNIRRDSATGQVTKIQTDIIQDPNNRIITTIKREQVRDPQGNILRYETSRVTENNELVQETGTTQRALAHTSLQPTVNQHKQISVDSSGNVHVHEQQIVQSQQKTILFNKNTVLGPEGNTLTVRTNVVQIQGNQDGNVHKHKSQIIQEPNKVTLVQTNQIIDLDGYRIRKQNDTIQIYNRDDGKVVKKQTDYVQQNGQTRIIKKGILQDQYGNVIKSQTKVINIEQNQHSISIHQKSEVVQQVDNHGQQQQLSQIRKQVNVLQDQSGNTITHQKQYIQHQSGRAVVTHRYAVENTQGDIIRQNTQTISVNRESQTPQIQRHIIDYKQQEGKAVIVQKLITQDHDGSIIKSQKQTVQIEQLQDGTIRKIQTDVVHEQGRKFIYARNTIQDQTGKILSKTSDMIQIANLNMQNALTNSQNSEGNNIEVTKINRRYRYDEQGNAHITQTQLVNSEGAEKVTERQYLFNQQGQAILTQTGITQKKQTQSGNLYLKATDIIQQGQKVTIVETNRVLDQQGNEIRKQQGSMHVRQIGEGLRKKQKETIVQQGGIKYKVSKQTYQDQQGNIVQEKCMRTQISVDDEGNHEVLQRYTRKQQQVQQDQEGNYHLIERQITDDETGKLTIVQTNVIRDEDNSLLKATTDVVQLRQLDDGSIHRHEVNIIQKPGKVTIAQNNSIQNIDGQKLVGQVQSIVVKQGPNDSIIKQQTNVIMEDQTQYIKQKIIIEDSQGNIIGEQGRTKTIYKDEDGVQTQRQVKKYQIEITEDEYHQPELKQRQVVEDQQGNVHTIETQVIQNVNGNTIIEIQTIKSPQGQIIGLQKNVIKTEQLQQGIISTENKQILTNDKIIQSQTVTLANPDGSILSEKEKRVQITEQQGLIRKSKFDIIRKQGKTIVGVVNTLQDQQGNVIKQSNDIIKIRDGQQALKEHARRIAKAELEGEITAVIKRHTTDEHGFTHFFETQVIKVQDKRIVVKTQSVKNLQGQIIKTVTTIIQQLLQDGQMRHAKTEITEYDGQTKVVEYTNLSQNQYKYLSQPESQQGLNLLSDQNINNDKIQIKLTHSIDLPYNSQQAEKLLNTSSQKKNVQFDQNQNVKSSQFIQENEGSRSKGNENAQLPIFSKKQLEQPCQQQIKNQNYHFNDQQQNEKQVRNASEQFFQQMPQQYYITVIDKQRNQIRLKIFYDDIIDEVAGKLGSILGKSKDVLKFYKDGSQLQEFQLVSDLEIFPDTVLYFIDESQ